MGQLSDVISLITTPDILVGFAVKPHEDLDQGVCGGATVNSIVL